MKKTSFLIGCTIFMLLTWACKKESKPEKSSNTSKFDNSTLALGNSESLKKLKGQLLYMPVYSNIPYSETGKKFNLSAFVAIHNTDLNNSIKVTKVLYFDNGGNLVANYLPKDSILKPLATADFFIPERDQSGTGANFLVEWLSDSLVNEPLIESVMIGLTTGQGVSFSSAGKVLRERR
jgi:hypothetical protein